jgi:DNA-binding MarR family transcriptional regulator
MSSDLRDGDNEGGGVMPALRLDQQLCFVLYACSRAMTGAYKPMLQDLGLTYPQYLVMMVLWEWVAEGSKKPCEENSCEEPSVTALGERLMLDSGTLTPLLKRLEQRGLLVRRRDTADERRVLVEATDQGLLLESKALEWVSAGSGVLREATDVSLPDLRDQLQALHKTLRFLQS